MRKPEGWDDVEVYSNARPKENYYILKIINVAEGLSKNTDEPMLRLELDIIEGEFDRFYTKLSQKLEKNLLIRYNQLTEKKESLPFFKKLIMCVEKSNMDFKFNFDPNTLRGKKVGAYLSEYDYESKKGTKKGLRIDGFYTVGEVREEMGKQIVNNLESADDKKDIYDDLPFS